MNWHDILVKFNQSLRNTSWNYKCFLFVWQIRRPVVVIIMTVAMRLQLCSARGRRFDCTKQRRIVSSVASGAAFMKTDEFNFIVIAHTHTHTHTRRRLVVPAWWDAGGSHCAMACRTLWTCLVQYCYTVRLHRSRRTNSMVLVVVAVPRRNLTRSTAERRVVVPLQSDPYSLIQSIYSVFFTQRIFIHMYSPVRARLNAMATHWNRIAASALGGVSYRG